jgi:serine O-acetyltransferase
VKSRSELHYVLEADRLALGIKRVRPKLIGDDIWKYQRALRHYEYWLERSGLFWARAVRLFWHFRYYRLSIRLNFEIPPFVAAAGLSLAHRGPVIVNPHARIGRNCRIHSCVNIGTAAGTMDKAPQIGDNCYIGPGAKLFGAITIADGVAIAAQAVVHRDCLEPNVTLGGVPAKIIARKSALPYLIDGAGKALAR